MDGKTILTAGAFAVAGLSLFLAMRNQPTQVVSNGGGVGGLSLGDGPVFNISTRDKYNGGGGYPPFNTCGCGRATNGINVATMISPLFSSAIQLPVGVKPIETPETRPLVEVGNGAFV